VEWKKNGGIAGGGREGKAPYREEGYVSGKFTARRPAPGYWGRGGGDEELGGKVARKILSHNGDENRISDVPKRNSGGGGGGGGGWVLFVGGFGGVVGGGGVFFWIWLFFLYFGVFV